jgi:hypothetical protein
MLKACALLAVTAMSAAAAVRIDKIDYKGWRNSYRVSNGTIELVITSDIGPRVMFFGFPGGQNLFKEFPEGLGKSGEKDWQPRGGHRIWIAPEDRLLTYAPDNTPVKIVVKSGVLEATQPVEPLTGLEKQIVVRMTAEGNSVEVLHRIRNAGKKAMDLAPWALTMMAAGGMGITGFPPRGTHPEALAPTNPLVMWAFTDLSDKRWIFTTKYLMLRQDPNARTPQKLGHFNPNTWGAYLLGSDLFVKRYTADPQRTYPDFGCSYETFTNADMLELETLGAMTKLAPGAAVDHTERWTLHQNVRIGQWTDAELDRVLLPLVK